MSALRVDVWSDIACPWCYVGKRRLESALTRVPFRDSVEVVWRAFELDPSAPRDALPKVPYAQRLVAKYGSTLPEAQAMIDRMSDVGAAVGISFRFDRAQPGNTFDAHRLIHFAGEHGRRDALNERFLRAYLSEGEPIGETNTLVRLAGEVGLEETEVRSVLDSDAYADAVRVDERAARELGIRAVPFFLIGGRYAISGAQPGDRLADALTQAWEERSHLAAPAGDGTACAVGHCS